MQPSFGVRIPEKELVIETSSGEDRAGRLFHWNNKIFRGIHRDHEKHYQKILGGSIAEELFSIGVVHTVKAKESFEDFRFVLQHEKIPLVTYPTEWCSGMLKDAALLTCDIEACLIRKDYALKDAHPWNVLFHKGKPVFIDFGSIVKKSKSVLNFFLLQCRSDFIRPLILKRSNFIRLVDTLMISDMGIWHNLDINRMLFHRIPFKEWFYFVRDDYRITKIWRKSPSTGIFLLRNQIESIKLSPYRRLGKNKKEDQQIGTIASALSEKKKIIADLFEKEQSKSLMIFGIPEGDLWPILYGKDRQCVIADKEEETLNKIYSEVKRKQMDVLPIRLDLCSPQKAYGINDMCKAPQKRLRMDLGIMLWSSYARNQFTKYSLEKIVEGLSMFVKNKLVIEFEENDHEFIKIVQKKNDNHFSLDKFQEILRRCFKEVRVHYLYNKSRWLLIVKR